MSQGVRWQVCKPCLQWCNTLGESSLIPPTSSASWDWTPVSNRMRRSSPSCSSPYSRTRSCTRAAWWSRRWSRTSSGASTPMSPSVQTARENLWVRHKNDFILWLYFANHDDRFAQPTSMSSTLPWWPAQAQTRRLLTASKISPRLSKWLGTRGWILCIEFYLFFLIQIDIQIPC